MVESAYARDFDVVVINYRGMVGCEMTTPRFYVAESVDDVIAPMNYIYEKYCKPYGRKAMAVGYFNLSPLYKI